MTIVRPCQALMAGSKKTGYKKQKEIMLARLFIGGILRERHVSARLHQSINPILEETRFNSLCFPLGMRSLRSMLTEIKNITQFMQNSLHNFKTLPCTHF